MTTVVPAVSEAVDSSKGDEAKDKAEDHAGGENRAENNSKDKPKGHVGAMVIVPIGFAATVLTERRPVDRRARWQLRLHRRRRAR